MLEIIKEKYKNRIFNKKLIRSSPVLCYHSIGKNGFFSQNLHFVNCSVFEKQIHQLKQKGFSFLPIDEYFHERCRNNKRKITSLTFDDGYKDILVQAVPILEAYKVPFTIFLSTCLLENKMFWRDKIRIVIERNWIQEFAVFTGQYHEELFHSINWNHFYQSTKANHINSIKIETVLDQFLIKKNISLINNSLYLNYDEIGHFNPKYASIGNHTHGHYRLSTLTKEEQYQEILKCQKILNEINYLPIVKIFAVPFGENGSFNQDTMDILQDMAFDGFLLTNQQQLGLKNPEIQVNPYSLKYSNRILPRNEPFYH